MANPERRRLTRGQASLLIRMFTLVSLLLVVGGVLTMLAPQAEDVAPEEIAMALPREPEPQGEIFPRYADFASERGNPFAFKAQRSSPIEFKNDETEPDQPATGLAILPPQPDVEGLELVGTAPGSVHKFAVFADRRIGLTFVVAEGQTVRNAVLTAVFPDRAIIAVEDQELVVRLTQIPGSEVLDRILRESPADPDIWRTETDPNY